MKPRIGFVLEQALGHVAYGMSLREVLQERTDLECVWLEIPYELGAFKGLGPLGRNWTVRGSWRAQRAIHAARKAQPLDALFLHTQTISLFSGLHMARIPTLLSLDATPINYDELANWYGDVVHPPLVEKAKLLVHKTVMHRAAWYTTWSQWTKDSLVNDYGVDAERITILHPGTRLSNFPRAPSPERGRTPGPLRCLFVGGDFKRKGGDLLLEVYRRHLRGMCELHLVTGADVETEAGVHVYRGLKPHSPELLRLYSEADVFVLPTRGDCLAVVLGEAMASGLPIITTKVGAHAEAVEHERSGFLLDVDDAGGLQRSLSTLAREPALVERMGRRSREIGEQKFDVVKNANRIADLLVEMSKRPALDS